MIIGSLDYCQNVFSLARTELGTLLVMGYKTSIAKAFQFLP